MIDHEALARQCEEAGADRQRELLDQAWDALARDNGFLWTYENCPRFEMLMEAEAYVDAALMLVPEGWNRWAVTGRHSATVGRDGDVTTQDSWVFAATPALALLAAILRSQGGKDAD